MHNRSPSEDKTTSLSKSPSSFNCKTIITGDNPYRFLKESQLDKDLLYQNIFRSRSQIKSSLHPQIPTHLSPYSTIDHQDYEEVENQQVTEQ